MAEILVMAFDTYGPDDATDRFAYKLGHVIDIKPDGHVWGSSEGLPKFYKVKLPGVSVASVEKFIERKMDFTNMDNVQDVAIRKWKLSLNDVPTAARNTLMKDGVITISKANTFDGYMKLIE